MASEEHTVLSDFIKSVHSNLRQDSGSRGEKIAWEKHCADQKNLQKYANAMLELATKHWSQNSAKINTRAFSRVQWTSEICQNYFFKNGIAECRTKELEIGMKMGIDINLPGFLTKENKRLKLLDVGSCYNPFNEFDYFEVLAIDIAPANKTVLKCDFLNLVLNESSIIDNTEVKCLLENSFDIVVFSLLLEYFPSPKQRLICCEKAYKLLRHEGLLIIITPDSKHVGANAKFMKSWRFVLTRLGFSRIKYEKLPHIHCMAFRKSLAKETAQRWAELHKDQQVFEEIYIPQDFNSNSIDKKKNVPNYEDNGILYFDELPDCDSY